MSSGKTNTYFLGPGDHTVRPAATYLVDGTMYACTTHGVLERVSSGQWADYTQAGATGPPGPQGETGATGAQGPAGPGVPAGGTTGQILTKTSGTDYATSWQAAAASGAPSYGTSLPQSPADGQEAILVDSTTNPTYQWRFRYNAGSSSPYKWEFVGGSPAVAYINPLETLLGTSGWIDAPTVGPQITVPRAGDYRSEWGMGLLVVNNGDVSIGIAQGAGVPARWTIDQQRASGNAWQTIAFAHDPADSTHAAVPAATALRLRYFQNVAGTQVQTRSLRVYPVRVS